MADNITIFDVKGNQVIPNIDAVILGEKHSADNEVADQVIENGFVISDHVFIKPDSVEISLMVDNRDGLDGERAKTVWQELKRMRNSRQLMSVLTTHELYENMAIETLSSDHESPYRGQLKYDVKFRKIDLTNFNAGVNTKNKFVSKSTKEPSLRSTFASKSTEEPSLRSATGLIQKAPYLIWPSAVDETDYGYVGENLRAQDLLEKTEKVFEKWIGQILNIQNVAENYLYTEFTETYLELTKNLKDSMRYVNLVSDGASRIQTMINQSTYISWETTYNNLLNRWSLNLIDSLGNYLISGIMLVPGTNLLEGYSAIPELNNLFLVDVQPNASALVSCFGEGIKSESIMRTAVCYFDNELYIEFKDLSQEILSIRALNFDLEDLDYKVS